MFSGLLWLLQRILSEWYIALARLQLAVSIARTALLIGDSLCQLDSRAETTWHGQCYILNTFIYCWLLLINWFICFYLCAYLTNAPKMHWNRVFENNIYNKRESLYFTLFTLFSKWHLFYFQDNESIKINHIFKVCWWRNIVRN